MAGLSLDKERAECVDTHRRLVDSSLGRDPEAWMENTRFRHHLTMDTWRRSPIHTAESFRWRARAGP
jgi:hypothetical protein